MYSIFSGKPYPLGASYNGEGTNFAVFSGSATAIEICLFDPSGEIELQRLVLPNHVDDIWFGFIPGLKPGDLYGLRAHGPYSPHEGHRFNPNKLLLDPYATRISGPLEYHPSQLAYCDDGRPECDMHVDTIDSAPFMPKCIIADTLDDCPVDGPEVAMGATIIYELHVKGYTKLREDIDEPLRGTYKALCEPSTLQYLRKLGVTSVELLPVHASCAEPFLHEKNMPNYWGYNSYSFFVLQPRYAMNDAIEEMRQLVSAYHKVGIEVLLDVVYNHTSEGNHLGPTHCFKGLDNRNYYQLMEGDKRYYANHTGCGNSVNLAHPRVMQMVMDSLRYLVQKIGIDGFRFDLATTLGRNQQHYFSPQHHFFAVVAQDPVLARVKMIAEPWDIGYNGYQVGNFPNGWHEWNDKFRDTVRRFWLSNDSLAPEFARRMHGSSDVFERPGRSPYASVNFVTSHDGFTLRDLVSYNERHNLANGENNRDGHGANFSYNHGIEGPTKKFHINALRLRQQKNLLASLLLSQGIPMLLAGDEIGNSQAGNNNAYCQDNPITWLNWPHLGPTHEDLLEFTRQVIHLRKHHPLLNRPHYQHGSFVSSETGLRDIDWVGLDGEYLSAEAWHNKDAKCFGMLLASTGENFAVRSYHEICSIDDAILMIFNGTDEGHIFELPKLPGTWQQILHTGNTSHVSSVVNAHKIKMIAKSFAVLSYLHKDLD